MSSNNKAHDAGSKAGEAAETVVDKAHATAGAITDTAQAVTDKAQAVVTDSREMIGDAKAKVEGLGTQAVNQAESAMHARGEQMTDLAETVRAKAPSNGRLGDFAASGADALERSGTYLQESDLADVGTDIKGMIRRHPFRSLAVGLSLGYLVARTMRR